MFVNFGTPRAMQLDLRWVLAPLRCLINVVMYPRWFQWDLLPNQCCLVQGMKQKAQIIQDQVSIFNSGMRKGYVFLREKIFHQIDSNVTCFFSLCPSLHILSWTCPWVFVFLPCLTFCECFFFIVNKPSFPMNASGFCLHYPGLTQWALQYLILVSQFKA